MKTLLLTIFTLSILHSNQNSIAQIAKKLDQAAAIQKSKTFEKAAYDPFSLTKKQTELLPPILSTNQNIQKMAQKPVLTMIFNQKAFINSKWHKKNEKIDDYLIKEVLQDRVILENKHEIIVLKLNNNDKKLYTIKEKIK